MDKKSNFKGKLIIFVIFAILGYAIGFAISYFIGNKDLNAAWTKDWSWIGLGVGAVAGLFFAFKGGKKSQPSQVSAKTVGKTAEGVEMDLSVNAKLLSPDEIKNQRGLIDTTWSQLPTLKNTGIVFQNAIRNGKYHISMKDEYHCLVVGATASGKTWITLVPSIRILAHSAEKPDMVINDPKGELYQKTSKILAEEGYRVYKYDLREPFTSARWNPLSHAYDVYHEAKNFKNTIKKCSNGTDPTKLGYKKIPGEKYGDEWYGFNKVAYPDQQQLKEAVTSMEQMYTAKAIEELRETAEMIAPKSNASDPTWEDGAKNFLHGCMLAMLEDSMIPELGMTRDKFNFFNLARIVSCQDPDPDNPFETLKKYLLEGRDPVTSQVPGNTSGVVAAPPNTAKSYISVLSTKLGFLQDLGIAYMTSDSDMDFSTFTDKPTVLYIVIPDDKENRYPLANICISQLYQRLVDKAQEYPERSNKLPRHVYFLLDEFGNMPAIPKMQNIITVARGRNILFELAIQSYTQLESKYGKETADIIKSNCNAQIFIGTDDIPTREDFSKRCGDVQLVYEEESKSKNDKNSDANSKSISVQRTTRPLITPYELGQLPFGTVIVKLYRYPAIKIKQTPAFETPFFHKNDAIPEVGIMKSLDRERIAYDIKMRNKKILKSSPFDF